MNILILGSGGREHSLAWAVKQNPKCDRLIVAPGNAGIAGVAECAALDIMNVDLVVDFALAQSIDFVIVGPEDPLAAGVADALRAAGVLCFGPSAQAARLEASKAFTKEICAACNAPTAGYAHFTDLAQAKAYVQAQGAPIVIKADGLAAGKGVVVAMTLDEALAALDDMLGGAFGDAGAEVVIEEFMDGEEAVEYNVRFGDPECQVLMMRLGAQALDLLLACAEGRLAKASANWADDHAITVVMATKGYPGSYEKGSVIRGLDGLPEDSMNMVFHAGTKLAGEHVTAVGGRVLNVTARGATLAQARARAYAMVGEVDWPEGYTRSDIGWRALD